MRKSGISSSASELKIRLYALSYRLSGLVEECGMKILEKEEDPKIRREARAMMITVIPIAYGAIYQPEPIIALLDLWAFSLQMKSCYETGEGKDLFGPWQSEVVRTSKKIQGEIEELARAVFRPERYPQVMENITGWARENPIGHETWVRRSTIPILSSMMDEEELGAFAAVAGMAEAVNDLRAQANAYSEHLPKQIQWQAESLLEEYRVPQVVADVNRLSESLASLQEVVGNLPETISRELEETRRWAQKERIAVLRELEETLKATMKNTLADLQGQRQDSFDRAEMVSLQLLEKAGKDAAALIDHTFWRMAQILAALAIIGGIGGFWAVRRMTRTRENASR